MIVLLIVAVIAYGVVIIIAFTVGEGNISPFKEGVFVDNTSYYIDSDGNKVFVYAKLIVTAISEEEYLSSYGVNVVKDESKDKTNDYYSLQLYYGEDKDNLQKIDLIGVSLDTKCDPHEIQYDIGEEESGILYVYYSKSKASSSHLNVKK